MPFTPINTAEVIADAFWEPVFEALSNWTVAPGPEHGLRVEQYWCWVAFSWTRKPTRGPALGMSRRYDLDCSEYDALMVSAVLPTETRFHIRAKTDKGTRSLATAPHGDDGKEYFVDLKGAKKLLALTLEIVATADEAAGGWFNWVGLRSGRRLVPHQKQWGGRDRRWEKHLKPESFAPKFVPRYGFMFDGGELGTLRRKHNAFLKKHGESPFTRAADAARELCPEELIHGFLGSGARYGRDGDPPGLQGHGLSAAIAGTLLKDRKLLRLAARYALSMALCEHWEDGMICAFPGGSFEHRCFVSAGCAHDLAMILDLAGEYFTDFGREYILKRLAQEGLGAINFVAWKHDYVFHCNQLALFSRGRIPAYAVLETHWPGHVTPYLELAHKELVESIGYNVLPDGGNPEGSIYCLACLGCAAMGLYYYARARGLDFQSVVPEVIKRTEAYAAAIVSTDEDRVCEYIPLSDSRNLGSGHDEPFLAMLAAMVPDSQWVTMFRRSRARSGGLPNSILTCLLEQQIPGRAPDPPAFTELRDLGMMASTRKLGRETVKLVILGNKAGGGHSHEDKGSFVLEFAGETFAMDPGACQYTNPLSNLLSNCERHNMLVPVGTPGRPHPQNPPSTDIRPTGTGDARSLRARMDVSPGWEEYYRKWVREWKSPAPDRLIIRDTYELFRGSGVEFYWNTQRDITIEGNAITLTGRRGSIVVRAPEDCTIRVDQLPLHHADGLATPKRDYQQRIAICRQGTSGVLEIAAQLTGEAAGAGVRA